MESPLKKFISQFYRFFVCYIPLTMLFFAGLYVTYYFFKSPLAFEHGKLFFGLDITTATLAGLCFYASYTSRDEYRKTHYYDCAEKFLHAMLLFVFITFLQDIIIRLQAYIMNQFILKTITFILGISIILCFISAFRDFIVAIANLLTIFQKISKK